MTAALVAQYSDSSNSSAGAAGALVLWVLIVGGTLAFVITALVSVSKVPTGQFTAAGMSKGGYLAGLIVGLLLCGIVGIVTGIIWFASGKKKVTSAAAPGWTPQAPPPPPTGL